MKRTLLAFALVPLVLAAVLYRDAGAFLAVAYAYALTYLFGIPLFLFLKRRRKRPMQAMPWPEGFLPGCSPSFCFRASSP